MSVFPEAFEFPSKLIFAYVHVFNIKSMKLYKTRLTYIHTQTHTCPHIHFIVDFAKKREINSIYITNTNHFKILVSKPSKSAHFYFFENFEKTNSFTLKPLLQCFRFALRCSECHQLRLGSPYFDRFFQVHIHKCKILQY